MLNNRKYMRNKLVGILSIGFCLFFVAFIVGTADDLSKAREKILRSESVADITKLISTRVLVSKDDLPIEGDWVAKNFDDSKWSSVSIPSRELVKERGYVLGSFAYYRIKIPKEAFKKFKDLKGEISFAPQYILFSKSDIAVNGKFLKTITPKQFIEYLQVLPVPDGEDVIVAIKGLIKTPLDTGIDHRTQILLGKGTEFNELYVAGFKRQTAYQLVFILCKGSILFIFALIFLTVRVDSSFVKFFFFGVFTLIEELVAGNYFDPYMEFKSQIFLYDFSNVGATVFVMMFFAELLGLKITKKWIYINTMLLLGVSLFVTFDAIGKNWIFDINGWMKFWNVVTIVVMVYFVPRIYKSDKILLTAVLITIALYVWSVVPSHNVGLNFKRYGNLLLFVMVAYQTFVIFRREQDQLKSKERQLLEQEKDVAIGKIANMMAHDIRKPLDQMKIVFERLASGEADKDFIEMAKKDIDFSFESITHQVNDVLNFNKNTKVELKEISLYKILSHGLKQVMSGHQEMNLNLEYEFSGDQLVIGDESRLSGVIVNLISNAVEAIRDIGGKFDGVIRFSTYTKNGDVILKIFNNGPEIPREMLSNIFKPLFTHGKSQGTGLGLASAIKAMKDQEGAIEVSNISGEGVEFSLKLKEGKGKDPYDKSKFLSSSKAYDYRVAVKTEAVSESSSLLRILILGETPDVLKNQDVPYKVSISNAKSLSEARELIGKMRFDFYLLDRGLGGEEISKQELGFLNKEVLVFSKNDDLSDIWKQIGYSYERRPRVLLVDDTKLFRVAWEMYHGRQNISCVGSPEEALQVLADKYKKFDAYVLDYHFSNSSINGEKLASMILKDRPEARIFISSSLEQTIEGLQFISKKEFEVRKYLK